MSVLRQVNDRLAALENRLADRPEDAHEVRAIRQLLAEEDSSWIGMVEAQRLLGVKSVNAALYGRALPAGVVRSRRSPGP